MSEFLKKNSLILELFGFLIAAIIFKSSYSILALLTMMVMFLFYSLFYTDPPKIRTFFMTAGFLLIIFNFTYDLSIFISAYVAVASLECLRMIIAAVMKYPSAIQDLKSLTEELEKRVEERTAELQEANQKLQIANDRLSELDKMKSAFVSQASHDLRTPLTAIKGSLDNLALGIAGELTEKQTRVLERARTSVNRLTSLINDVLDLSRIESGRTVLEKSNVSMRLIVEQAIQENKPAAEQRRIALNADDMPEEFIVFVDGGKMERIVGELIGNAIKYTPEGGDVSVRLFQENNQVVCCVKDSGIGMTEEDCQRIWERFYRSNASKHFAKGSGLGLSIAKELIDLHGGSIEAQSEEGKGTTLTLRLPLR
ncbi:MAG: HAMP domain-containing histidine kinase [Candidatus Omnitrophica bacterium]|nr:HAMP domain-containing histidine kinase [Candidatus Omnitrophota bacterium]